MIELREFQEIKRKVRLDQVKIDKFDQKFSFIPRQRHNLTRQDCELVDFTWSRIKTKSKLTNFMKLIRIEGYNGK